MFLYCWLKKLRNQPSQILLSLVIALFFGQLLFFFGVNFTKSKTICIFIASVTHYSFLVAFFCINVMAFDFCRTFFSSVPISRDHRRCLFSSEDFSHHPEDEISDQVQVVQLLLLGPAFGSCRDRSFARPYVKVGLRSFYISSQPCSASPSWPTISPSTEALSAGSTTKRALQSSLLCPLVPLSSRTLCSSYLLFMAFTHSSGLRGGTANFCNLVYIPFQG